MLSTRSKRIKNAILSKIPLFNRSVIALLAALFLFSAGCTTNDPYRAEEKGKNVYYTTFNEPPKHLDPARSYSSDEYEFLAQIYEPPLQYQYLRRPYELTALSAEKLPVVIYKDKSGRKLPDSAAPEKIHRAEYEVTIKKEMRYENHPAFAKDKDGRAKYANITSKELDALNIGEIKDFPEKGTRTVTSDDFIYQIMRLADPEMQCPIAPMLEKYILGFKAYSDALKTDLALERKKRKEAAGAAYNREIDEKENPIVLDYARHDLPGVVKADERTYRIILTAKYPQFIYWLAMPFFAPMPIEAIKFYAQPALAAKNITLDRFPVGSSAFRMETHKPNMEITLVRNENFHGEQYPSDGEADDAKNGLLKYSNAPLPFIDKAVFKIEKEAIPRWNKFLQGYYDASGIASDSFDQAVSVSDAGRAEMTEAMKEKGMRLKTSVRPITYYNGFNMLDPIIGGLGEDKRKLRQAISVALDIEEYIEIFNNGRGIPAMSLIPPGIFGYVTGPEGINRYVYDWDNAQKRPVRKTIDYAKKLLAEAGYPNGVDKNGAPLVITFDNYMTTVDSAQMINWYTKRFKLLGIQLENRTTDYNRFQEKMLKGNFQFFFWGWNADYPDPENFLFLLAGENGKVKYQGENAANYLNPEFDRLFKQMENMDNSPERLAITKRLLEISRRDAPLVWGFHPVAFGLEHAWVENAKPNVMANNTLKYIKIDAAKRETMRHDWNVPRWWPVAIVIVAIAALAIPAVISARRRNAGRR